MKVDPYPLLVHSTGAILLVLISVKKCVVEKKTRLAKTLHEYE